MSRIWLIVALIQAQFTQSRVFGNFSFEVLHFSCRSWNINCNFVYVSPELRGHFLAAS